MSALNPIHETASDDAASFAVPDEFGSVAPYQGYGLDYAAP